MCFGSPAPGEEGRERYLGREHIRQDMLTYLGDARSLSETKVILCRQECEQILRSVTMNSMSNGGREE